MDQSPTNDQLRNFNYTRLVLVAILGLLILVFYFTNLADYLSWDTLKAKRDEWRQLVHANWTASIVIFMVLSITLMSISMPVGSALSLTAGALFDLWGGVILITIASSIGSTFAFLIARYLLRDFVRHWFGRWLGPVYRGFESDGSRYLLMLRLSPVVPFFAVNAAMGLTGMRLRTFFLVTLIGILPSCFLYVMVGTQIMKINSPKDIISTQLIVLLTLLALTPVLFGWIMRRLRRTAPEAPATNSTKDA
jgi:uncharacterized membrane protein YdjX (TVP38/TMEM64 family)